MREREGIGGRTSRAIQMDGSFLFCVVSMVVSDMVSSLFYNQYKGNPFSSKGAATMKSIKYLLHRYATPNHVRIALALLALVTFVLAGGAPEDGSGNG